MEFTKENLQKLSEIIKGSEGCYMEAFDQMKWAKEQMFDMIEKGNSDTRIAAAAVRYKASTVVHTKAGVLDSLCSSNMNVETLPRLVEIYEAYKEYDNEVNVYASVSKLPAE